MNVTNQTIDTTLPLFAWAYPTCDGLRLTIGPHIDEPVAEVDVPSYHASRELARVYGARPRNF